jgi:UDP-N-acetylglucosamine--N-acetylmuramyl-(pentapeptide) pyrophosphoryl-undecaprenol N-acetylglucosamine transferase
VQARDPNAEAHAICSERSVDHAFLEKEGIPHTPIPAWKLLRQSPMTSLRAFRIARRIVQEWKPDAVFCKGGAVSVPVAWAAKREGIPIVLHESDAVGGKANRLIARWAAIVCLGFPASTPNPSSKGGGEHLNFAPPSSRGGRGPGGWRHTGNPVRPSITRGSRVKGLALTGFSGTRSILLIMGGSQGAETINQVVVSDLPELLSSADIIHITGEGKTGAPSQPGYWSRPFAHEELADLYAITDLAISRSGAGSIAELAACGIPTILVPLPGLANDHQTVNAVVAQQSGGCIVLAQDALNAGLVAAAQPLMTDPVRRRAMSEKIRTLSRTDAPDRIAEILLSIAEKNQ